MSICEMAGPCPWCGHPLQGGCANRACVLWTMPIEDLAAFEHDGRVRLLLPITADTEEATQRKGMVAAMTVVDRFERQRAEAAAEPRP